MIKVIDRLEVWTSKKKVSMQKGGNDCVIRVIKHSELIDTDKISHVSLETFDPFPENENEASNLASKYLEANNIETFAVSLDNGALKRNLVKPKNVSLLDFLFSD